MFFDGNLQGLCNEIFDEHTVHVPNSTWLVWFFHDLVHDHVHGILRVLLHHVDLYFKVAAALPSSYSASALEYAAKLCWKL